MRPAKRRKARTWVRWACLVGKSRRKSLMVQRTPGLSKTTFASVYGVDPNEVFRTTISEVLPTRRRK